MLILLYLKLKRLILHFLWKVTCWQKSSENWWRLLGILRLLSDIFFVERDMIWKKYFKKYSDIVAGNEEKWEIFLKIDYCYYTYLCKKYWKLISGKIWPKIKIIQIQQVKIHVNSYILSTVQTRIVLYVCEDISIASKLPQSIYR